MNRWAWVGIAAVAVVVALSRGAPAGTALLPFVVLLLPCLVMCGAMAWMHRRHGGAGSEEQPDRHKNSGLRTADVDQGGDPLAVLQVRLARGEITIGEYERLAEIVKR